MSVPPEHPVLLSYSDSGAAADARAVATIVLNDPDRRNALGRDMFDALERALDDVAKSCGTDAPDSARSLPDFSAAFPTRVVVIRANGPAFCAGFDLRAVAGDGDHAQSVLAEFLRRLHRCVDALSRLPAVTVAAVGGAALAGGCALVSACDFVVAAPEAQFGYPTHAIGLSPAVSGPTLSSRMGLGAARELLLGGHLISGERAVELGLASHLASTTLDRELEALTRSLLAKGALALRATKLWLRELDPHCQASDRQAALAASLSGVGGDESVKRVAAIWKKRS